MQSQGDLKNLNKSISVVLLVCICVLLMIFTLQGPYDESAIFEAFFFLLIPITVFQILYVIVYKVSKKTIAFWLMIVLIIFSVIFCGLLWYASQLAKGFNH